MFRYRNQGTTHLEVKVQDVFDVDPTAVVVGAVREAALLPHEVGQGVVPVRRVPGSGWLVTGIQCHLSDKKVEFWKPT